MMKIAWWWCWEDYTLRWLPLALLASGFLEVGGQTRWQMHQHPSVGVTDSFLSMSHITQTRRAHQVTAACLHIPMNKAYEEFTTADLVTCLSPAYNQPVFALRQLERVKEAWYWMERLQRSLFKESHKGEVRILINLGWISLRYLRHSYMTARAACEMLTKSGKKFSQERGDPFLPLKLL